MDGANRKTSRQAHDGIARARSQKFQENIRVTMRVLASFFRALFLAALLIAGFYYFTSHRAARPLDSLLSSAPVNSGKLEITEASEPRSEERRVGKERRGGCSLR